MSQKILIEPYKSLNKSVIGCIHKKNAIGKRMLLSDGWSQCKNPNYMSKGELYAHYNSILKLWIISK